MRSADKVALVYAMHRTNLYTLTAAGAYGVVYYREVVSNLNRSEGAGLFTLHTADTAVGALFTCNSALFVI